MHDQPNQRSSLLGVDVGGTKIATLLVDQQLQPRAAVTTATDLASPQRTLECIAEAIDATLSQAGLSAEQLSAIGVGVPGMVDTAGGVVDLAVNLNWRQVAAGPWLAQRFGVPCYVENDVRAAAAGIHRFQAAGAVKSLAYLAVGTGMSAGLVLDGRLHRGVRGLAGEIGHVQVEPDGPLCACGARGCLETLAAGPAIAQLAEQALRAGTETALRELPPPLTATAIYHAAEQGDPVAQAIAQQIGRYLGRALYHLSLAYDIEIIVLGGGVATAGAAFLQPILDEILQLHAQTPLAQAVLPLDAVRLLPAGYQAGTWGSVAVAEAGAARVQTEHNNSVRPAATDSQGGAIDNLVEQTVRL